MTLQTFWVNFKFRRRSLLALSIHRLLIFVQNMGRAKRSRLVHLFVQIVNFSAATLFSSTNIFLTFKIQFIFVILTLKSVSRKLGLAIGTLFSSFVEQINIISVALDNRSCRSLELIGIWCSKFVIKTSLVYLILNCLYILVSSLNKHRRLILLCGDFSRFWLMIGWSKRTFRLRIILVWFFVFFGVFIRVYIIDRRRV